MELLKWHNRSQVALPLRYARRLVVMGPLEMAARLRERRKKSEAIALPAWEPPDRSRLAGHLERQFLFGPAGARRIVDGWRVAHPERAQRLIHLARWGLQSWEIFGVWVALDPGALDWQAGDERWVWELNRHQFLFTFARAFALTGDPAYARRIVALVEDWRENNAAGHGVNWASALEVGMRAISWLWTLPLLLDWGGLQERFLRGWLTSLHEHYQYLKHHLSLYTDRTNHLIGETAALWMLSIALPGLRDGERQQRRAMRILAREIERQVTPDGVGREQSAGYQRFVMDFYRQVAALSRRSGRRLPPILEQRLAAMHDFLNALSGEAGEPPSIGDSDGARGVPFPELSGSDPASEAADLGPWLGEAAPEQPQPPRSRVFRHGGYCLWQAEHAGRPVALLFDVGPLGLWPNASHGHADALSVQVKLGDRWFLGDPGTGAYAACRHVRDLLRGTAAHNTVTVDNLDQADALDVFKWLKPVRTRLLDAHSSDEFDYAVAVHEGYQRLRRPVTHYRAVLFVRPPSPDAGWIIVDRLEGEGRHECALRFHFPPETELHYEHPQGVLAIDQAAGGLGDRAGLRFFFAELLASEEPVRRMCRPGLWSRRFGHWEQAPVLSIERTAELPLAWFTFLALAGARPKALKIEAARNGRSIFCARGRQSVSWSIDGPRHRFCYRRSGERPGLFEKCWFER